MKIWRFLEYFKSTGELNYVLGYLKDDVNSLKAKFISLQERYEGLLEHLGLEEEYARAKVVFKKKKG